MSTYDHVLLTGVRGSKAPEDVADMGPVAELVKQLDDTLAAEAAALQPMQPPQETAVEAEQTPAEVPAPMSEPANIMLARISEKAGQVDEETQEKIRAKESEVKRLVDAHVCLAPIPSSEKKALEVVQSCAAGRARGREDGYYVGIVVDPGMMGEPITAPHIRVSPLNIPVVKADVNPTAMPSASYHRRGTTQSECVCVWSWTAIYCHWFIADMLALWIRASMCDARYAQVLTHPCPLNNPTWSFRARAWLHGLRSTCRAS